MKMPRSLDSVVLKPGVVDRIVNDIGRFKKAQEWYHTCGVPYRRGYLLYGPPGTGKTSLITALAGHFDLNVCVLQLASKEMSDSLLSTMMSRAPSDSLILLEDIDVGLRKKDSQVTLSGLLNALDGVASQEGKITFLTTNNISALPPALLRPGRCDLQICLDEADADQIARLFLKFHREDKGAPEVGRKLGEMLEKHKLTTARLQGYFMVHMDQMEEALHHVDALLAEVETEREAIEKNKAELELKTKNEKPVWSGVTCDGCNKALAGNRYTCQVCCDFDFCETCHQKNEHDQTHTFTVKKHPSVAGQAKSKGKKGVAAEKNVDAKKDADKPVKELPLAEKKEDVEAKKDEDADEDKDVEDKNDDGLPSSPTSSSSSSV